MIGDGEMFSNSWLSYDTGYKLVRWLDTPPTGYRGCSAAVRALFGLRNYMYWDADVRNGVGVEMDKNGNYRWVGK